MYMLEENNTNYQDQGFAEVIKSYLQGEYLHIPENVGKSWVLGEN